MDMAALCREHMPYLEGEQADKLAAYYHMLVDWNGRMNLTAITDPVEAVQKHFADSLLPRELIPPGARAIDVGSGAGFPGLPLAIVRPDISVTLLDSLNKRITFLQAACAELGLRARCIHARAEDGGRDPSLREKFDVALSRAVASAPALLEYTAPFLKAGGLSLMYKGPQAAEELAAAKGALKALNCRARIVSYPAPWGERHVIAAEKLGPTPGAYPRKAGTIAKKPL